MELYSVAIRVQKWIVGLGVVLLGLKFWAFILTDSIAILTDAFESIVNVVAGSITLVSLILSSKPKDSSHPYGHGKAEFISAGIEGTLIVVAGIFIFVKSIEKLLHPSEIKELDMGIFLIGLTGFINLMAGLWALKTGKKTQSLGITATGKHLISDAYSTIALLIGLVLIVFTGYAWIDPVIAICFGILIIYTGTKIIRSSLAGIMDEADDGLLKEMVVFIQKNRKEKWIDLHNLRVIKYGNQLHIDCHLTLPWYYNLVEAHDEIDNLTALIRSEFGSTIEFFVHVDGCLPFSCRICRIQNCKVRQHDFEQLLEWTTQNVLQDQKHEMPD